MSEKLITASSFGPGTAPPVHIAGLSQSPLTSLAQVMVESNGRISSRVNAGRKTRGDTWDEVRGERRSFRCMAASPELMMRIKDQMRISAAWVLKSIARGGSPGRPAPLAACPGFLSLSGGRYDFVSASPALYFSGRAGSLQEQPP